MARLGFFSSGGIIVSYYRELVKNTLAISVKELFHFAQIEVHLSA